MGHNFKMVAKTLFGFEDLLANELKQLGGLNILKGLRMVSFEGDNGFMYKANLALRTAIKILKPIHHFKCINEDELYKGILNIDWSVYLNTEQTLAIDATVFSDYFNHSKYVSLKCKDAIVDQFRTKTGVRPNVDIDSPDIRINIHIHQDECTVSLDTSGNSLHQRGYKSATNIAPINEVLAAGLLLMSGWDGQCDFLDPMCGSGTILIEAAMIACNIPANINRTEFAFERWNDWDEKLFEVIKSALLKKTREFQYNIIGYDTSMSAIRKAQQNVLNAGLEDYVQISLQNFFKSSKEQEGKLHILFNPPYDERISIQTEGFYQQIGDTLKQHYAGTTAWFITGNLEALKYVGLKPSAKLKVFNGNLEARLVKYELYDGSRKFKATNNTSE
jgi:putative N6-adenine-specific DNA methylase